MDPMSLALFALVSQVSVGQATASEIVCGSRDAILNSLSREYAEAPQALGLANNGSVIELLTTQDGKTWTILMSKPDGNSCVIAAGEAWENIPPQIAGRPM